MIPNCERLFALDQEQAKKSAFTPSIHHCSGGFSWVSWARMWDKKHPDWEGISTINMISYIENHKESTKNLLKLANEFPFPFPSVFKLKIEYSDDKHRVYFTGLWLSWGQDSCLFCRPSYLAPVLVPYAQKMLFTYLINECLLWKRSMKNKISCTPHKVVIWRLSLLVF